MKFSLILATVDRTDEISGFLDSLKTQTYHNFELIVVDQNEDNRLESILRRFESAFPILHLKSGRGLSKARNVGLREVSGDIIAFPDDDCRYPSGILEFVNSWFAGNEKYAGLSGRSVDQHGNSAVGNFELAAGPVDKLTVWRRMTSIGLFVRANAVKEKILYDEKLGLGSGTEFGAGEDIDFPLQILSQGYKIYYEPSITVIHPPVTVIYDKNAFKRGLGYGGGIGFILKKHNYPAWFILKMLIRPVGGVLLSAFMLKFTKAWFHFMVFRGRIRGLLG